MKHKHLRIVSLLLTALILTTFASASTDDGTFSSSSDSNRRTYTPKSCSIQLDSTHAYFNTLKWDNNISYGAAYYWEGELRGEVHSAYSSLVSVAGSLPYLYKEYDNDDTSIGCRDMSGIVGGTTYYAALTLNTGTGFSSGADLWFESEYGIFGVTDGLPLHYQAFATHLNTRTKRNIAWLA